MAGYDFRTQRLFVEADLADGATVEANRDQANYLLSVLRMKSGGRVLLFNGRDGEWLARLEVRGRKSCSLALEERTRVQPAPYTLVFCFAPLKMARLDYMVQNAVEMGAGVLQPVITEHTQVTRVNLDRARANAREAAEQCGILSLPDIREPVALPVLIAGWPPQSRLVFCDEAAPAGDDAARLASLKGGSFGLLIGPEGGFTPAERQMLGTLPFVEAVSLGPRILRADTAAVAALAVIQMIAGDWNR